MAEAVVAASPILVASRPSDHGDWSLPTRLGPGVALIVPLASGTGCQRKFGG